MQHVRQGSVSLTATMCVLGALLAVAPATVCAQLVPDAPKATPKPAPKPLRPAVRPKAAKGVPAGVKGADLQAARPDPRPPRRALKATTVRPPPPAPPPAPPSPAEQRQLLLAPVQSWGFQLRLIRFPKIAEAPLDLVVIDHALSAGRRFIHEFSPEQVRLAKSKPDGSRRLVLAYLSIGEAERYRFYWKQEWYEPEKKPAWLGSMNTVWDGNYLVRFWEPEWQRLIFGSPEAYLERIKAAGFDGIYVDRADVHAEWAATYPGAERAMVSFIAGLAAAARADDPTFLVLMQNAEELLTHKAVLDAIDGIAKEDLFYGIDHLATANDPATVEWSLRQLRRAQRAGRKVILVEYLSDAEKAAVARRRAEAERFVIHFTSRDLGDLTLTPPDRPLPAPAPGGAAVTR
jgi:cysteinyl-tRNA synthetase